MFVINNIMCMCRSREWSGDFTTSFQDLLPGGTFHIPGDQTTSNKVWCDLASFSFTLSDDKDRQEHLIIVLQEGEEPEYSLITGRLVSGKQGSQEAEGIISSSYLC